MVASPWIQVACSLQGFVERDVEHGAGRVDAGDPEAPPRQPAPELARAAADVEDGARPELVDQRLVVIEVVALALEVVVDARQACVVEDRVGHAVTVRRSARRRGPGSASPWCMLGPMTGIGALGGRVVRLRPLAEGDRAAIVAIRATDEVRRRWRGDDLDAEFDHALDDPELQAFAIEDQHGAVVGMIQFAEVDDPEYRSASIDVFVAPDRHRRGYATDAIRTLVDVLFDRLGHHRLTIDPSADNIAAIECYRKLGFRPVGVMRQYEQQADGTWADGLLMDMLVTDRTWR